ncbi:MAG: hypothetical protein R3F37_22455 [Candidatus Competibacteraceae bacterium]
MRRCCGALDRTARGIVRTRTRAELAGLEETAVNDAVAQALRAYQRLIAAQVGLRNFDAVDNRRLCLSCLG